MNAMSYHGVHHAFPRIPFYALAKAHRRLVAVAPCLAAAPYTTYGMGPTLRSLAATPCVLDHGTFVPVNDAATEPKPLGHTM